MEKNAKKCNEGKTDKCEINARDVEQLVSKSFGKGEKHKEDLLFKREQLHAIYVNILRTFYA